ncbi:MAG: hypothetical protein J2P48_01625 [Alphaproteobacteria bacterium]|nr:hypothetical protein [Alphaproteobacteria bacterium]
MDMLGFLADLLAIPTKWIRLPVTLLEGAAMQLLSPHFAGVARASPSGRDPVYARSRRVEGVRHGSCEGPSHGRDNADLSAQ